jgi:hypothetical protein
MPFGNSDLVEYFTPANSENSRYPEPTNIYTFVPRRSKRLFSIHKMIY